jgi:hypothetical protein
MVNHEPNEEGLVPSNFRRFIIILKPKSERKENSRRDVKGEIVEEATDSYERGSRHWEIPRVV